MEQVAFGVMANQDPPTQNDPRRTKYAKIYVLHRAALLILLILPLANKGFLWYALSTERVSPMKS